MNVNSLIRKEGYAQKEKELISEAFSFAQNAHREEKRASGDPYFTHVFEVGKTLAELGMDAPSVAAALLHDTLEGGGVASQMIEKKIGREVLFLVEGVTKLKKYEYQGRERHAESLRRFLLSISKDPRVLVIKLADRLHNLKTLSALREDKQRRIALDTLEIYAPIANRLGMGRMKGALEDLAFPYVDQKAYEETKELLKQKSIENQKYLEKVHRMLQKELYKSHLTPINIDYRIKHLYSLYRKLKRYDMDIEKIYDIAALRIVVPTVEDCYRVLGVIHGTWRPLPARVKDYIASPKLNGYQSLHTTIFTGDGGIVEIQIRTPEMHEEAEFGIAAHIIYKDHPNAYHGRGFGKRYAWIRELVEWQKQVAESGEFLKNLKADFFRDRVFAFTPDGDVVDLPEGSTSIDFAYAIHTSIGDHAAGVRINGKFTALDVHLKNGDIVEIITRPGSSPSQKWLEYTKTALARKHVKAALQKKGIRVK